MLSQVYNINGNLTLTNQLINYYVDLFWTDVFKPLHAKNHNIHLMIMCKLQYSSDIGDSNIKTLGQMRMVNISNETLYSDYFTSRLGILSDSYTVTPFNQIFFTYIIRDGQVPEGAQQLLVESEYVCKSHSYNNAVLPISMNPEDYGPATTALDGFVR